MKKKIFIIGAVVLLFAPIVVNFICLSTVPCPIIGDGKAWHGFFGSYLGGVVTVLITLYVLYTTIISEKYKREYEMQQEFYYHFCDDLAGFAKVLDYEEIPFILQSLKYADTKEVVEVRRRICEIDLTIKKMYNAFFLKYGHLQSRAKDEFADVCEKLIDRMRNCFTEVLDLTLRMDEKKKRSRVVCVFACKDEFEAEICNLSARLQKDFEPFPSDKIFRLSEQWKKEEWQKVEDCRTMYLNYCK